MTDTAANISYIFFRSIFMCDCKISAQNKIERKLSSFFNYLQQQSP